MMNLLERRVIELEAQVRLLKEQLREERERNRKVRRPEAPCCLNETCSACLAFRTC